MRQTLAIFLDAYRELNSKRLFWITLALSGLVVAAFAAVGIDDKGLKLLAWHFPSNFNTAIIPENTFYKWLFVGLGIKFWLTWLATILALVSTAGIIPDLVSSGSIELTLSKPIGRARLFITKYAAGLLFVTLQVSVFTLASFLVIGIRGRAWELGLFWAVPLTVCAFSFIYSICALVGLVTRSTVASLLLTLLVWFGIFGIHTTEQTLLMFRERSGLRIQALEKEVEKRAAEFAAAPPAPAPTPAPSETPPPATPEQSDSAANEAESEDEAPPAAPQPPAGVPQEPRALQTARRLLDDERRSFKSLKNWHFLVYAGKAILPKTSETTDLLQHKLISAADLDAIAGPGNDNMDPMPDRRVRISGRELRKRVEAIQRSRTTAWVLGTSLAFEAVVVGLAALIFSRRDF